MKILNKNALIGMIIFAMASLASAQLMEPPSGMPPVEGPMRERLRERIKTIKVWKLTEELNLTEAQGQKFFPIYNKFFDIRENIEKQRFDIIRNLSDLTGKENPSESEIIKQLNKIDSLELYIQDLKVKFRKDLAGVLSTRQIGQLYVFEIEFARQIQDIIRDARQEKRGRGFGGGPGD